jgi:hypothetical protein
MSIQPYGRYWALYDACGALICLTVYKKGALEVVRRLQDAHTLRDPARRSRPCPSPHEPRAPRGARQP